MVSEHLSELYKNVRNPFEEIENLMQSEEYKQWQEYIAKKEQKSSPAYSSLLERLRYFLQENAKTLFISLLVLAGILAFVYLLVKLSQKSTSSKTTFAEGRYTVRVTGKITNISLRTPNVSPEEGFFKRRPPERKPYGLVEFTYNGFKYTKGFYLPKSPEMKVGTKVTLLLNPRNANDSVLEGY